MPDDLKKNKILLLIYGQITAVTWAFILESLSFDHQYCYPIQNHKLSLMDCTKAVSCHTQFCEIWLFLSHPISLALAYKSCASLIQPWACMPHIPNVLPSFLGKNEKSFIGPLLVFGYVVLDSAIRQNKSLTSG